MKPLHFLVLAWDPERREQLVALLRKNDHQAEAVPDEQSAADAIESGGFDGLVLDLDRADLDVGALCRVIVPAAELVPDSLEAAERRHLAVVLRHTAGNKRRAAHLLGISRSTLLNKVRKYRLENDEAL
jgi:DNA-binding NtrC family response regulator